MVYCMYKISGGETLKEQAAGSSGSRKVRRSAERSDRYDAAHDNHDRQTVRQRGT